MTAFNGLLHRRLHTAAMLNNFRKFAAIAAALLCIYAMPASADIWRWTDALGKVHYVNTLTPIYTWQDESGKTWYSDTPDHVDAVSVELVWHSTGSDVDEQGSEPKPEAKRGDKWAYEGETPDERYEREKAEAYYCKRAQDVYNSYLKAPRLFKTSESGEREYLSDGDAAQVLTETKARVEELCDT